MISPFVSVLIFVSLVLVHILFHRVLVRWGIVTDKTIAIYALGFFFPLPLTGMVLYGLLVAGYLLFFLSVYFEGESPSVRIMTILREYGPLAERDIRNRISNKELFNTRLTLLVQGGYVRIVDSRWQATAKGRRVAAFFNAYRRLLQWDFGGL